MSKTKSLESEVKTAEALGHIKRMPEAKEELKEEALEDVLSNPEEFRAAIGSAQMDGKEFVEVTEDLFKFLIRKQKTRYITYGDPGIKVYIHGTREEIENEDMMNAEDHHTYVIRKMRAEKGLA